MFSRTRPKCSAPTASRGSKSRLETPSSRFTASRPFWLLASGSSSGLRQRNPDVPILHSSRMIALNIQRTGLAFMAVDGAPCDSGDLLIVDGSDSIANHRDMPAHQRYVVGLPCAG